MNVNISLLYELITALSVYNYMEKKIDLRSLSYFKKIGKPFEEKVTAKEVIAIHNELVFTRFFFFQSVECSVHHLNSSKPT